MFWVIICITCFVAVCSEDSVGGLPRKPEDVSVNIKNVEKRQYYVNWQLSRNVSHPAGTSLNVSYSARFHIGIKGWNCNTQPMDAIYGCDTSLHITVDSYQFQCKVKQSGEDLYLNTHCIYNVSVIANNSVGQVESDVVYVPIPLLATPLPPLGFKAQALEDQQIIVTWTKRSTWEDYKARYVILYHAEGEFPNRTSDFVTGRRQQITLEDGIEALTMYYVYMNVVLYDNLHNNASSDMIGPEKVSTPEGEPNSPEILRDISHVLVDASFRNVTLEWETPAQRAWRGVPKSFRVHYIVYPESLSENATGADMSLNYTILNVTNTSTNRTVLARLKSAKRYLTFMTMCNTKKCSLPGMAHIIEAESMKREQTQPTTPVTLIAVTISVAIVLILAIIIGVYCYRKRFAPNTPAQPPLKDYEVEPSPAPGYEDIPVNGNEYHRLQEEE